VSDFLVATEDLFIGRARAHLKGDTNVPAENAEKYGWQDKVVGPDTKTAARVAAKDAP
jgi:hypothetical protein